MLKKDIKRNKLSCRLMTGYFIGFIALFSLMTLLSPDREFSETENRPLKQRPVPTAQKVLSGEFGTAFEDYMADQIFMKDSLMSCKTTACLAAGMTLQNGVYFGKGGCLLQRYTEDRENLDANISAINAFADAQKAAGRTVNMMLVPNSICLNADKLPAGAVTDDQLATFAHVRETLSPSVKLYDPTSQLAALQRSGVQAYYRTDHHWTSQAAKYATDNWLGSLGLPYSGGDHVLNEKPGFYGTLYSKVPTGFMRPDTFSYYSAPWNSYSVTYTAENKTTDRIMDLSYLDRKDKYSSFLGGNFAHIVIRSKAEGGKVLLLKDSYANAAVTFFADRFSEVHIVDLRYLHTDTVSSILDANGIESVFLLYNVDFLNEDKNFVWLG